MALTSGGRSHGKRISKVSLDAIACDPELADGLSLSEALGLMAQAAAVAIKLSAVILRTIQTPDVAEPDEVFTVKGAAAFLKISPAHLYSLTNENKVPHFYVGKSVRLSRNALRDWIRKRQSRRS